MPLLPLDEPHRSRMQVLLAGLGLLGEDAAAEPATASARARVA
jgi:hypothetical protein